MAKEGEFEKAEDGSVIGTDNQRRLDIMAQIADQAEREIADQLVDVVDIDKGITEAFEPGKGGIQKDESEESDQARIDREAAEKAEQDAEAERQRIAADEGTRTGTQAAAGKSVEQKQDQFYEITVNGVKKQVTLDELIRSASKVEAADTYLAQAAEYRRQAEQEALNKGKQPSKEDAEAQRLEKRRALARAIQMGTEDEAVAAIEELEGMATGSVQQVDEAALMQKFDARLSFKAAESKFMTEFSDIASDPRLMKMASETDAELLRKGDKRDFWERYSEIGNSLRQWRDGLIEAAGGKKPDQTNVRQLRKAAAPQTPAASAALKSAPATPAEEREKTPSEIIAEMARARGGPQSQRG